MSAHGSVNHIAEALGGHRAGATWMCRCPAHHDATPSLAIRERDGRLLVFCHAGCEQDAVLGALRRIGLWPTRESPDARGARRALPGHLKTRNPPIVRPRPPEPDGEAGERAARVAAIVAECVAPDGTPADRYLTRRGITRRPLPDCIRFRPSAWRLDGAIVALATDDAANVQAVQQVYIDNDGRKADLLVAKRTNGPLAGATVRFPGTLPLILTEGIEDALTLWQETGRATWASLGVSAMASAPVPEGAEVVIARDNDLPGSAADKAIDRAVEVLLARRCRVKIARPPGGAKDFNDALRGVA